MCHAAVVRMTCLGNLVHGGLSKLDSAQSKGVCGVSGGPLLGEGGPPKWGFASPLLCFNQRAVFLWFYLFILVDSSRDRIEIRIELEIVCVHGCVCV